MRATSAMLPARVLEKHTRQVRAAVNTGVQLLWSETPGGGGGGEGEGGREGEERVRCGAVWCGVVYGGREEGEGGTEEGGGEGER